MMHEKLSLRKETWEKNKDLPLTQVSCHLGYTLFQIVLLFVKTNPLDQDKKMLVSCKNPATSPITTTVYLIIFQRIVSV